MSIKATSPLENNVVHDYYDKQIDNGENPNKDKMIMTINLRKNNG